jgi:hypothetical protein
MPMVMVVGRWVFPWGVHAHSGDNVESPTLKVAYGTGERKSMDLLLSLASFQTFSCGVFHRCEPPMWHQPVT